MKILGALFFCSFGEYFSWSHFKIKERLFYVNVNVVLTKNVRFIKFKRLLLIVGIVLGTCI